MLDDLTWQPGEARGDTIALFLAAAERHGAAAAVGSANGTISYAGLAARVRGMAGAIARRTERGRVLIALPAGADAYAAMFAVGMAGSVYAPVNRAAPLAKQLVVSACFAPDLVIASRAAWQDLAAAAPGAVLLDPADFGDDGCLPGEVPLAAPLPREACHPLAYVIFTSGSTGRPKGVEIGRDALDHYVAWLGRELDVHPGDRVSQYANIAFDLSVMEIYGALCRGASLHPPGGNAERLFPAALIHREALTHWISVPSVVSLMRQAGELTASNLATVRRFTFCGEALTAAHVQDLLRAAPHAAVQNTYGPTEATVSMTSILFTADDVPALTEASVAIGAPIAGMSVQLVADGRRRKDADEGELVLLGPQLARGYLDDPETTARAFRIVETPAGPQRGYFTGDWVRRIGGQLYFQSRIDFQIKHKGYRIELGEIQSALAASGAPDAVVFAAAGKLVAIVADDDAAGTTPVRLRQALKQLIEAHAVPDVIVTVAQLPRNDNDKIDRNAAIALYRSGERHSPLD